MNGRLKWLEKDDPSRLLFFKEKHSELICHVPTKEKFFKVCLWMLERRLREGFYSKPEEIWDDPPSKEKIQELEENKKKIKNNVVRDLVQNQIDEEKFDYKQYRNYCKWYEWMEKALKEKNGQMAYACLCDRNDYEYESFEMYHMILGPDEEERKRKAMKGEAEEESD